MNVLGWLLVVNKQQYESGHFRPDSGILRYVHTVLPGSVNVYSRLEFLAEQKVLSTIMVKMFQ